MAGIGGGPADWDVRLQVRFGRADGCAVAHVGGEVDHTSAERLTAEIGEAMRADADADRPVRMVLDLSGVTFFDSSGLGAVVRLWKAAKALGGEVGLAGLPHFCMVMLERTGLAGHLTVAATVRSAALLLTGPAEGMDTRKSVRTA